MAAALLEVGRVDRPHGVAGEVVVSLVTNRTERLQPGAELQIAGAARRVRRSRPFGNRWIVAFEGCADRDAAEQLRSAALLAAPLEDPAELWVHELIGAEVVCTEGSTRGKVLAVQANPASDLLALDSGALVPLTFVVSVEAGDGPSRVVVDAPEGLFDLP
ncbi:MAG: ribosome maturation factor RimM [bacterium]|nr:ribosome maturation factor RimM [bacterium]MCY3924104.1 ribosome maturation factor RimM [bacterium]